MKRLAASPHAFWGAGLILAAGMLYLAVMLNSGWLGGTVCLATLAAFSAFSRPTSISRIDLFGAWTTLMLADSVLIAAAVIGWAAFAVGHYILLAGTLTVIGICLWWGWRQVKDIAANTFPASTR